MSAVFYHNKEQRLLAERSRDWEARRIHRPVATEILPAGEFFPAEGYHQKFALKGDAELARELHAFYPGDDDFTASTAAARINGYVSGYGSLRQLDAEIDSLGLSEAGKKRLRETVGRYESRRGSAPAPGSGCPIP
jgi:hypothetical protein